MSEELSEKVEELEMRVDFLSMSEGCIDVLDNLIENTETTLNAVNSLANLVDYGNCVSYHSKDAELVTKWVKTIVYDKGGLPDNVSFNLLSQELATMLRKLKNFRSELKADLMRRNTTSKKEEI